MQTSAFTESQITQKAKIPQEECLRLGLQGIIRRNAQVYLKANIHLQKLSGSFGT